MTVLHEDHKANGMKDWVGGYHSWRTGSKVHDSKSKKEKYLIKSETLKLWNVIFEPTKINVKNRSQISDLYLSSIEFSNNDSFKPEMNLIEKLERKWTV